MIRPEDLRLKNWVHNPSQKLDFQLTGRSYLVVVEALMRDNTAFEPIPLTSEWQDMLEFEMGDSVRFKDVPSDFGAYFEASEKGLFLKDCDGGTIGRKIEFVHQFQNTWYDLTGQELELNKENVQS